MRRKAHRRGKEICVLTSRRVVGYSHPGLMPVCSDPTESVQLAAARIPRLQRKNSLPKPGSLFYSWTLRRAPRTQLSISVSASRKIAAWALPCPPGRFTLRMNFAKNANNTMVYFIRAEGKQRSRV